MERQIEIGAKQVIVSIGDMEGMIRKMIQLKMSSSKQRRYTASDDVAFKKRVAKRRAKKGYR